MRIAIYETSPFNKIEGLNEKEINLPTSPSRDDNDEGGGGGTGQIRILSNLEELGVAESGGSDKYGNHEPGWELRILFVVSKSFQTVTNELIVSKTEFFANNYYDFTSFVESNGAGVYILTILYPNFESGRGITTYYEAEGYRAHLWIKPLAEVVGDIEPFYSAPLPGPITLLDGSTLLIKSGIVVNDTNSQVDLKFTEIDESGNTYWTESGVEDSGNSGNVSSEGGNSGNSGNVSSEGGNSGNSGNSGNVSSEGGNSGNSGNVSSEGGNSGNAGNSSNSGNGVSEFTGTVRMSNSLNLIGSPNSGGEHGEIEPGWEFRVLHITESGLIGDELVMSSFSFINGAGLINLSSFVATNGLGLYIPTIVYPNYGSGGGLATYYEVEGRTLRIKPIDYYNSRWGEVRYWSPTTSVYGRYLYTGFVIKDSDARIDLIFTEDDESNHPLFNVFID